MRSQGAADGNERNFDLDGLRPLPVSSAFIVFLDVQLSVGFSSRLLLRFYCQREPWLSDARALQLAYIYSRHITRSKLLYARLFPFIIQIPSPVSQSVGIYSPNLQTFRPQDDAL